jgi:hypothetical protein
MTESKGKTDILYCKYAIKGAGIVDQSKMVCAAVMLQNTLGAAARCKRAPTRSGGCIRACAL